MDRDRLVPYLSRLYGYAFSLTFDADAARDLVQECALRALEARRIPTDEPAFRAWLFIILRNASLDRRRRAGRNPELDLDNNPLTDAVWDCDDGLINTLTVRSGMEKLSTEHREIIGLIDIAGFSYHEAAGVLDIPIGTVMSRVSRARKALLDRVMESNVRVLERSARRRAR